MTPVMKYVLLRNRPLDVKGFTSRKPTTCEYTSHINVTDYYDFMNYNHVFATINHIAKLIDWESVPYSYILACLANK